MSENQASLIALCSQEINVRSASDLVLCRGSMSDMKNFKYYTAMEILEPVPIRAHISFLLSKKE